MRVATLTFHSALNYGAVLQAYALQRAIQSLGHECEILDYRCKRIENSYRYLPQPVSLKGIVSAMFNLQDRRRRKTTFSSFMKEHLSLSKSRYDSADVDEACAVYDAFVVGSDQVWNRKLTGGDKAFFLDFASGCKRISYAASAGNGADDLVSDEAVLHLIQSMDNVSVREDMLSCALMNCGVPDVEVVADPVLLIEPNHWHGMAKKHLIGQRYVFAYCLHESAVYEKAREISNRLGLQMVYVPAGRRDRHEGVKVTSPSVQDFLGLIEGAEWIVTDSFHASALSILFQRPLLVQLKTRKDLAGMNSRLTSLLDALDLAYCYDMPTSDVLDIEYFNVSERVANMRAESLAWLRGALDG